MSLRIQNHIHLGNCITIMPSLSDESFDLAIADPPYAVMTNHNLTFTDRTDIVQTADFDCTFASKEEYLAFTKQWVTLVYAKLKPNSSFYCFFDSKAISHLITIAEECGFTTKNVIVWQKNNPVFRVYKTNYVSSCEFLAYFVKGYPYFHYTHVERMHNVWRHPLPSQKERIKDNSGNSAHPTQKPESVIAHILDDASRPTDLVLDPFSGVGTVNAVCLKKNRGCIGIEQNPTYHAYGEKRLKNLCGRGGDQPQTLTDF